MAKPRDEPSLDDLVLRREGDGVYTLLRVHRDGLETIRVIVEPSDEDAIRHVGRRKPPRLWLEVEGQQRVVPD